MTQRAIVQFLSDGRRLHMNDGPIDLIVEAFGDFAEVQKAYVAASARFPTILDELCSELPLLRRRVGSDSATPHGCVGRRMLLAAMPFASRGFITPMAAVAGAVAEEMLECMTAAARLSRAYVNDGGDIAIHLAPAEQFLIGMVDDPASRSAAAADSLFGSAQIDHASEVRGIATSGRRGRSFSLGIADAVTVLAPRAAMADAAATVIGNAVDLPGHPGIIRTPACELVPDSDLGDIPVTREVPRLETRQIAMALQNGAKVAQELLHRGFICAAALHLQGETQVVGRITRTPLPAPSGNIQNLNRSLTHA